MRLAAASNSSPVPHSITASPTAFKRSGSETPASNADRRSPVDALNRRGQTLHHDFKALRTALLDAPRENLRLFPALALLPLLHHQR